MKSVVEKMKNISNHLVSHNFFRKELWSIWWGGVGALAHPAAVYADGHLLTEFPLMRTWPSAENLQIASWI